MTLVGAIFGLVGQSVHGWLSGAGEGAVEIELLADGQRLTTGRLDDARAALPLPTGARSFCIRLPSDLSGVSRVEAYVRGALFAVLKLEGVEQAFAGAIEAVGPARIEGWAVDLRHPERPVTVDVFFAGLWVGAVRTDAARPDIADRFGATQPCGFVYIAPIFLGTSTAGVFRLFVANSKIELAGSPAVVADLSLPGHGRLAI